MEIFQNLKNEFPRLEQDFPLKDCSTFRIGGSAKYFLRTSDIKELKRLINRALEFKIPFHVLGGGSNTLIGDGPFDGLVIIYGGGESDIQIGKPLDDGSVLIKTEASIQLSSLIMKLKDFSGLEWGVSIPGTLGGAINGNAGAFGESISNSVESVEAIEASEEGIEERKLSNSECSFSYRASIFKKNSNLIIVSATLRLQKADRNEVESRIKENLSKRIAKQPKGFSIGSIFKNYRGGVRESFEKEFPEMKNFREKGIIPAGFLIESCGLKGKKIGGAKISEEHANFIINCGDAKSSDVIELIKFIKKSVKEKFLINLEEEIQFFNCQSIDK